jgi:gliding motility-associated-like protein
VICEGSPHRISVTLPDITSYLWSTGSVNPYIDAAASGSYWLEVDRSGCIVRDTIEITVAPLPEVELGEDQILCPEQEILLDATSPGARYRWNTGDTTATLSVGLPGFYSVTVLSPDNCMFGDSIHITSLPLPTVLLGQDTVVCEETPLRLRAQCGDCETWTWSNGSMGNEIVVTSGGTYFMSASNYCGTSADTIVVTQIFCDIWVPNAFTPNGDGRNDLLRVLGNTGALEGFSFSIYNRWGERVFYTRDTKAGWDGRHKGSEALMGTYVYLLEYTRGGQPVILKGNFHVLR